MKKLLLATLMGVALAATASTHRLATYNIRFTGSADDTQGKLWDNRGPVCRDIIVDHGLDIIGLQEVCGTGRAHRNANTGRTQLDDLKAWLPDHEIIAWDRDGTARREYVAIAYRCSRYTLMDQGSFFIGPTPDTYSYGWDTVIETHSRVLGWLRLKENATGQEFIYACTHTNDGWSLDGPYGSELIVSRLAAIAGDLPVMLVADFNSSRTAAHSQKGLHAYRAAFHDAALTVPQAMNYSLPVTNRPATWTYNAFHPVSDTSYTGSEIDFQFYRGMNILERHIVTEEFTYGGVQYPSSDHFPVYVVAELAPAAPRALHVAAGSAGGDGTAAAPFGTIGEATAAAGLGDTIKIAAGTYNESVQPRYTVNIEGGYDPSFTATAGTTVIDGRDLTMPPVYVAGYRSLSLRNITVSNYTSTDVRYDGAIHFTGADLTLDRVTATANKAVECGGALSVHDNTNTKYCAANNVTLTGCSFSGNEAAYGGAIAAGVYNRLTIDGCNVEGNTASMSGGGAYLLFGQPESSRIWFTLAKVLIKDSSFTLNTATRQGALYINDEMPGVNVTVVNSTFASNVLSAKGGLPAVIRTYGGAAICARLTDCPSSPTLKTVKNSQLNMGHITVVGNNATCSSPANFVASAINIDGGVTRLVNSIVAANSTNGTQALADFTIGDPSRLAKETCNIFTAPSTVSVSTDAKTRTGADVAAGTSHLAAMMAGTVDDAGRYTPSLDVTTAPTHFVPVLSTLWGTDDAATLTTLQRNLERDFSIDIDGDGAVGTALKTDQLGLERNAKSLPGAADYHPGIAGTDGITGDIARGVDLLAVAQGRWLLSSATPLGRVAACDPAGHTVLDTTTRDNSIDIDLTHCEKGIYLIYCRAKSYKVIN